MCCLLRSSVPILTREQVLISLSAMALAHIDSVCSLLCYGCIISIILRFIPVQSGSKPPLDVVSTRMQFQISHTHVTIWV